MYNDGVVEHTTQLTYSTGKKDVNLTMSTISFFFKKGSPCLFIFQSAVTTRHIWKTCKLITKFVWISFFSQSRKRFTCLYIKIEKKINTARLSGVQGSEELQPVLCRQNLVSSLMRGMPKVVDCRQTGVQATNEMVMQNNTRVYPGSGHRMGLEQCITS
jgi:hypothetical protein